ncbi:MAG TPA: acyl-CoA dehydrogenase family protein [Phycisphaerae bacterium]|nr:acyl-CoA dehydrogenase family protein [Phycisphaerae bacterium]
MNFELTETQQAIRQSATEFAQRELLEGEINPTFDREGWRKCAAFGAMGVTIPTDFGGRGQNLNEFVAMMEGLGYGCRRYGLLIAINAHVFGSVETLFRAGSDEQKKRYLRKLATGEWVAAHSVTEPDGGSDLGNMQTIARKDGNRWVINGKKKYATCGAGADLHVVYAKMDDPERYRLSCFLVEPDTPGMSVRPLPATGLHGSGLSEVTYENVRVPDENILGKPGSGAMVFQGSIERERACIFGFVLGAMRRELELAVEYANKRVVGGRAIAGYQAVAHRIADMKVRLDASRLLLYHVTGLKSAGKRAPMEAAVAKLFISESFLASSLDLIRTFAGNGFISEGGIDMFLRDALGTIIFSGTNDIQRNIIAGQLGVRG